MGCFSWCLMDTRQELVMGQPFKVLIPEAFGGGEIITEYDDYGRFDFENREHDLYEIVAAWNKGIIEVDEYGLVASNDNTDDNRAVGISIGCYDHEIAQLKYPLRLVSISDKKSYEDYDGMFSIGAPSQGWDAHTVYEPELFNQSHYDKEGSGTS